jgi:hypothetical protein
MASVPFSDYAHFLCNHSVWCKAINSCNSHRDLKCPVNRGGNNLAIQLSSLSNVQKLHMLYKDCFNLNRDPELRDSMLYYDIPGLWVLFPSFHFVFVALSLSLSLFLPCFLPNTNTYLYIHICVYTHRYIHPILIYVYICMSEAEESSLYKIIY